MSDGTPLLEATGLTMHYGAVKACTDLDVQIRGGEILGIIGPNGSGKSTLLKMLAGHLRPTAGSIRLRGSDVTRWKTDRLARAGLVMTSQNQMVFGGVSVREALQIGEACRRDTRNAGLTTAQIVEMLHLGEVLDDTVEELPLGYLRRVGIALAIGVQPDILLLDEPAAGLNDEETESLRELILRLREAGLTVGIVDHDMTLMVALCDRVIVLDVGQILAQGEPHDVIKDPAVIDAYLGSPLSFDAEEAS
ncbi:ABC transporter ATP-binding protein [Acrocarpospora macrocephala]|uniref:ABC transporter ATP-binding protein n=1 Tax=Acrocarpospora macrocephala TaxID=150177 RepID=A0A5M3X7A7_9ACTN|nr:ATP-binding cassette domain-containing protein [Acrocarpospora macrocephala]GES14753.1 ABC transporter ATP-binding protein [Acrocarpospora macrocephala]